MEEVKKGEQPKKARCAIHKSKAVEFYCQVDKSYFCSKCVSQHKGHDFITLQEECAKLFKEWHSMNRKITRLCEELETISEKLDEKEKEKVNYKVEKFRNKFSKVVAMKEMLQYDQLVQQKDQVQRYQEKVLQFLHELKKSHTPKLPSKRQRPAEEESKKESEPKLTMAELSKRVKLQEATIIELIQRVQHLEEVSNMRGIKQEQIMFRKSSPSKKDLADSIELYSSSEAHEDGQLSD